MDPPSSPAGASNGTVVLLAHGAGGHRDYPHILDLSGLLRALGFTVVRFNFPYREKPGKAPPNPMPVLLDTVRTVAAEARKALKPKRLLLAGHSMGGRVFSVAAAEGLAAEGLILFSYPWHPPGKPDKLRVEHLASIPLPVLGFSGRKDPFAEGVEKHLKGLPKAWTQVWIEAGDHGLEVAKKSGRTREEVLREVGEGIEAWIKGWVLLKE